MPASSPAVHCPVFHLPNGIWGCISKATLTFSLRHYWQIQTRSWRENAPVLLIVCQNTVTPHSSSRTWTVCLAWGSKAYPPVSGLNLLKRKKMHPNTVWKQKYNKEDLTCTEEEKKKSTLVKLYALSRICKPDKWERWKVLYWPVPA